ncbi:hypothetical protein GCM10009819_03010 [Agromyces tropicus]|uniref:Histidine phosphatase family protein n=1 Tax=Agromyces tropicus TaxID=555371 RepID=A0ABN2TWQ8_9MICO
MIVRLHASADDPAISADGPAIAAAGPATVVLVRHGETDWNRQGRIQGATDIPMNGAGRGQARAVAERLAADGVWSAAATSPLSRASETATIIAQRLDLPDPAVVPGLRERRHGTLEGLTSQERRRLDAAAIPIEGVESRTAVVARAVPALHRLGSAHAGGAVVAVTHGGVIQSLLLHLLQRRSLPSGAVANGSVHRFRVEPDRLVLVESDALPLEEPTATA